MPERRRRTRWTLEFTVISYGSIGKESLTAWLKGSCITKKPTLAWATSQENCIQSLLAWFADTSTGQRVASSQQYLGPPGLVNLLSFRNSLRLISCWRLSINWPLSRIAYLCSEEIITQQGPLLQELSLTATWTTVTLAAHPGACCGTLQVTRTRHIPHPFLAPAPSSLWTNSSNTPKVRSCQQLPVSLPETSSLDSVPASLPVVGFC